MRGRIDVRGRIDMWSSATASTGMRHRRRSRTRRRHLRASIHRRAMADIRLSHMRHRGPGRGEHPFVGIMDLVAQVDRKRTALDFKTSGSTYAEHEV